VSGLRGARTALATVLCAGLLLAATGTAEAKTGKNNGGGSSSSGASGDGTQYSVHVSEVHRGGGADDTPIASSDVSFTPPVCWYTSFTPDQFKAEINRRYIQAGNANAGTVYNYYYEVNSDLEAQHYHKGDKGSWWVLTYDKAQLNNPDAPLCPYQTGWMWEPPGNPPKGAITPEILAQDAYKDLRLPSQGVTLSPVPKNQKVNLPTYVSYDDGDSQRSVTAQVTEPGGQVVAATVVAEPYSLRVDAGTQYASPQSCTYRYQTSGTAASLNSAKSSCNITYRKASHGTYTLTANTTWKVWWTPTADVEPNGTALPDGLSPYKAPVTVEEIQSVNR